MRTAVRDLLLAGTAAARDAGFTAMLSGHRGDARPWHVWHYRLAEPAAVSSPRPPAAGPVAPPTG